jgi:transcriptional regulator with XRE-family HTH domain
MPKKSLPGKSLSIVADDIKSIETLDEAEQFLIGHRIKEERLKRGLSQSDLAHLAGLGVDQTAISRIERGATEDPGVILIYRLARALGVSVESLVLKSVQVGESFEEKMGTGSYSFTKKILDPEVVDARKSFGVRMSDVEDQISTIKRRLAKIEILEDRLDLLDMAFSARQEGLEKLATANLDSPEIKSAKRKAK